MTQPPIVLSMARSDFNALCLIYGPMLEKELALTDDGAGQPIRGAQLLVAMGGRESSFGKNLKPRHEPAYDIGGLYWKISEEVRAGLAKYGAGYAYSYGPLQIMAVNAPGFTPGELAADPEKAMQAATVRLRFHVLQHQRARSIQDICECWNGGHIGANTTPGYFEEVQHHYLTEAI
jgi:hypothetical protein